jgi:spore maturation protein CgeB
LSKSLTSPLSHLSHELLTCDKTGLFNIDKLYFDELYLLGKNINEELLVYLTTNKIDIIVFGYYAGNPIFNPSTETIRKIREIYPKIKLVFFWYDSTFHYINQQAIREIDEFADLHIPFDGVPLTELTNKWRFFATPESSKLFYPDDQIEDVSFIGRYHYPNRREYIEYAQQHIRINLLPYEVPAELYAESIRRSKININFSLAFSQLGHQCKGRVFETLASHSLLLESENSITSQYIEPDVDYITFNSPQDLVDKAYLLLNNDDWRNEIAEHGYNTYMNKYHPNIMWSYIYQL